MLSVAGLEVVDGVVDDGGWWSFAVLVQ